MTFKVISVFTFNSNSETKFKSNLYILIITHKDVTEIHMQSIIPNNKGLKPTAEIIFIDNRI